MEDITRSILPLPPQVAAQIESSTSIPSLACVVLGLIANSLDAKACKIDVSVNFSRGAASVEDDGVGIRPEEFTDSGGLGKIHCEICRPLVGRAVAKDIQIHPKITTKAIPLEKMAPS